MGTDDVRFTVRLSPEDHALLMDLARATNRSINKEIAELVQRERRRLKLPVRLPDAGDPNDRPAVAGGKE